MYTRKEVKTGNKTPLLLAIHDRNTGKDAVMLVPVEYDYWRMKDAAATAMGTNYDAVYSNEQMTLNPSDYELAAFELDFYVCFVK